MLVHRFGPWSSPEVLQLDEEAVTAAWAWEETFLDTRIQGVLYNELTLDARFRRTRVRLSRDAIDGPASSWRGEAAEMLDPDLAVYPTPNRLRELRVRGAVLRRCKPAMTRRTSCTRHFRARPPEELEEGRLGGSTWGMGRGARPARFTGDDR